MKITALEVLKSGQGKKGPWNLVKLTADGKTATGFVYEKIPAVGDDLDLEFFQEDYNGKMQDKFRIVSARAKQANVTEMAIKTHIDQHFAVLRDDLRRIAKHLGMENVKKPIVPDEINPEDTPF